ncbi:MAG TPA: type II and III secretion system protein [Bryobacteraceae bacterium]|nr:type II and III secretion system protein [Bryobacteraceae bacterium]
MKLIAFCVVMAGVCLAADNTAVAARLARLARKAEDSGQIVRAYLLFGEAAARDPHNPTYRENHEALAPAVKLLTKAHIEQANVADDVLTAENEAAHPEPPVERASEDDWSRLASVPHVEAAKGTRDFDLRGTARSLLQQVPAAYGVAAVIDRDLNSGTPIQFQLQGADFHSAMEALTAATHTFVFAISPKILDFAVDTQQKRDELEPVILLTFPLPEALTEKDLIDAANAVRSLLSMRSVGWDSENRVVMVRDHATRAHVARGLMESLLLPRAELSFDVQFITADTDRSYQYGATLQSLFQFIDFGKLGGLGSVLPAAVGPTTFLTFGGGATLFGVGVAEASAFAMYSSSDASVLFDATVRVSDRQTVNLHIGDQYPIASSLYTGATVGGAAGSIYNPAPQITMEDLGLILKMTPHINGEGDIVLDVETDYKSLGAQTFNTVPAINERAYKGTVSLRPGEWAVMAGMDSTTATFSRSGWPGLGQIPGLRELLTDTTRDNQTSNTLIVIKPTIMRLPLTDVISPQFFLGPRRGERVLI